MPPSGGSANQGVTSMPTGLVSELVSGSLSTSELTASCQTSVPGVGAGTGSGNGRRVAAANPPSVIAADPAGTG
ncbi:MAG: hypothetical protein ACRDR6_27165 [Pseudonocardiaceae bacterium]